MIYGFKRKLSAVFTITFGLAFCLLIVFTNLNGVLTGTISMACGCISVLVYAYKKWGLKSCKIISIVLSFVFIPGFILIFSGIFDGLPDPWYGLAIVIIISIFGIASVFTLKKLNLIEFVYVNE